MGLTGCTITATQQRSDPSQQFRKCEGFDQVIISAELKPLDPIFNAVASGQEKHGDIFAGSAHLPEYFPPIHTRHHDVQNQQVIRFAQGMLKGLGTIGIAIHVEARLSKALLQIDTYLWLVFRNQKSHGGGSQVMIGVSLQRIRRANQQLTEM
ncbi:hypothetical protein D3C80_1179600 [compost metagenome]